MPVSPLGFEAWIEVEGKRLEEFKVESEGSQMVCWVPCEAGKEFRIACSIPREMKRTASHSVHVELDGIAVSLLCNVVFQNKMAPDRTILFFGEGLVKQETAKRAFQFGTLELTDDDTLLHATTKRFGEVTVKVDAVEGSIRTSTKAPDAALDKQLEDHRIHERSKKGLAHCVKLGEEKPVTADSSILSVTKRQRVCAFVFKYRHPDILVADGIAPREAFPSTSTPEAPENSGSGSGKRGLEDVKDEEDAVHDSLDSTDEQIRITEERLAALKAKRAQEEASGSRLATKRVKKEHKSTLIPGEIIDLTDVSSGSTAPVKKEQKSMFLPGEVIDLT